MKNEENSGGTTDIGVERVETTGRLMSSSTN